MTEQFHEPVLVREVCELLQPCPSDTIIDCNLGTGGHSLALFAASGERGFLVGLDLDSAMLSLARNRLLSSGISSSSFRLVHANHADLTGLMGDLDLEGADRILMDLGASSLHFDNPERGFSCQADGPLDMRYDRETGPVSAADIVNDWEVEDLARLFKEKGDERWAKKIAREIVKRRESKPFTRTAELAEAVAAAVPRKAWPPKIHVASRVFMALRVEVNQEDESLRKGLEGATEILKPGGRLAVITFQSHEDRTVKRFFRGICRDVIDETDPWGRVKEAAQFIDLTRKPIGPTEEEVEKNPRSRSAKLRGVEKKKNPAAKEN
ncbi:MAG: 16S rRNA (cytosine(1402)-N(4))-methyltransferase RsmH [Candidatus Sumerlaeia bacterium]